MRREARPRRAVVTVVMGAAVRGEGSSRRSGSRPVVGLPSEYAFRPCQRREDGKRRGARLADRPLTDFRQRFGGGWDEPRLGGYEEVQADWSAHRRDSRARLVALADMK
jgi:hypothetical protein